MKEQIIAAIKQHLGKVTTYTNSLDRIKFERACVNGAASFLQQESEQLYTAIAPHIEQPGLWDNAPEWAAWVMIDKNNLVAYADAFPSSKCKMLVPDGYCVTLKCEKRPE